MQFIKFELLLLFLALTAGAETNFTKVRPVTLRECIDLALQHNLDLQIVRRGPDIARFNLASARGTQYDPLFTFEAKRRYWEVPPNFNNAKFNDDNPYQQTLDIFEAGLTGRLTPGLSYELLTSSTDDSVFTDFSGATLPNRRTNNFEAIATLTLRQSLLKDSWIDAGRMLVQVNKKNLKISEQAVRLQVMRTILAVEMAYFDLIYAKEKEKLAKGELAATEELFNARRRSVEIGQLRPLSEKPAESQLESARANLLVVQDEVDGKQGILRGLMADDLINAEDEVLEPTDAPAMAWENPNRASSLEKAMNLRPELISAKLEVEKQGIIVRYNSNQRFPTLDLVGTYGGLAVEHESRAATFDSMADFENPVYGFGVVFSMPLGNTAARNSYKSSLEIKSQALLHLKKVEQDVFVQVDSTVKRLENMFKRVIASRKAREYAQESVEAQKQLLSVEKSTEADLAAAEHRVADAQADEFLAIIDFNKALAQLAFDEGTSLERNQITLEFK